MILAIETATDVCGVALVQNQNVIAQRVLAEKYVHSEKLLPMIDEVLRDASLSAKHLDAIAVSIGPGSFTGLRIGLSTAKGLALSLGISVIAIPTLDALAYAFFRTKGGASAAVVCPMIDAKRDEAFFCFYRIDAVEAEKCFITFCVDHRTHDGSRCPPFRAKECIRERVQRRDCDNRYSQR